MLNHQNNNMEATHQQAIDKLKSFIDKGDIAMLCTLHEDHIHSRPMATSDIDDEGNLWFFTNEYSEKVDQVEKNHHITLCYTDHGNSTYVCVNGLASVVKDADKMKELFNPMVKAYFPEGLNDPKLALLKVSPKHAEYWDSHTNMMVRFIGILGSALTDEKSVESEHGKIDFQ